MRIKNSLRSYRVLDKGWLELYGGTGGENIFIKLRFNLQNSQFSLILKRYFLTIVIV